MSPPERLASRDGTSLHLHAWPVPKPQATLLVVHGYMEHGQRYEEFAHALQRHSISVYALDLRGHGLSGGAPGRLRRFSDYLDDVTTALHVLPAPQPAFLLGHSLGGLIALQLAASGLRPLRGLLLSNPYLERALKVPRWKLMAGQLLGVVAPWVALPAGLDPASLTHDPEVLGRRARDPLIFDKATVGWFREINQQQISAQAPLKVSCPVVWCVGTADAVAKPEASYEAFARLQAPEKELLRLEGDFHEVLHETHRQRLFERLAEWMGTLSTRSRT